MEGNLLHVHSMYSLYDSAQTPEEIVRRAKEMGVSSVTLTDHGTLLGIPAFLDAGKKYGVNAVPGCEFYLEGMEHLVVVAKDYEGYWQISRALRDAWKHQVQGAAKKWYPVLTKELMAEHFKDSTHVFATTACIGGPVSRILLMNLYRKRKENALRKKAEGLQAYHEEWASLNRECDTLEARIRELKAEEKEYKSYLTKRYAMQLQKEREDSVQLSLGLDSGPSIEQKERFVEDAKRMVESIGADIKSAMQKKKDLRAAAAKLKAKNDRYEALLKEASGFRYSSEAHLREAAKAKLMELSEIFPEFYVELQNHGIEEELYVMPVLAGLAKELGIPVIGANDAHITERTEDCVRARKIMRFNYFKKAEETSPADWELYLKSPGELFSALSEAVGEEDARMAVSNTKVLDQCKVVFPEGTHYPAIENGEAEFDRLLAEAKDEKIKAGEWDDVREARLSHEVDVIKSMGFVDYHLVVRDFCNMGRTLGGVPKGHLCEVPRDFSRAAEWAGKNGFDAGVGVGPGRGSAAGSIVCYLLGITNIDPVRYNLLFERFLNPERVTMPDIDSDIKTSLRPTIIQYMKWKYGKDAVSSIATEDTYAARSALQAAARNLASEQYDGDTSLGRAEREERKQQFSKAGYRLSDLVCADTIMECEPTLLKACASKEEEQIVHDAKLIEGRLSGTGSHAGGVVISDSRDVCDHLPVHWVESTQTWATQCDMVKVEERGLLKMDVLGLASLDLISDCLQLIKKHHGVTVDLDAIREEPAVFREIYSAGRTNSVFQFESDGMKQVLKKFCPESIEDLILINACYRPGPQQYLNEIIEAKATGKQEESCLTKIPQLVPILSPTYGYPIYQEQVMQIFRDLAGYSLGGADLVRRAMSKKKMEKLAIEHRAFLYGDPERGIRGCVANGISDTLADELFSQLMEFSKYGFNKSHATVYAVVSYQMAWLKYHYPAEFLCSMFGNEDDYGKVMEDCETFHVEVLPPDINRSLFDFTLEDGKIRFGLCGIKGIANRESINRLTAGNSRTLSPYHSLTDFLSRNRNAEGKFPDKRIMEALIGSGCFDKFLPNREKALCLYQKAATMTGDASCVLEPKLLKEEAYYRAMDKDSKYNLEQEEALLGSPVSEHPLSGYPEDGECGCVPMDSLITGFGSVYGYVSELSTAVSRNGRNMVILTVKGKRGKMPVFCMGKVYDQVMADPDKWTGRVVRVRGNMDGGRGSIFADSLSYMQKGAVRYYVSIDTEEKAVRLLSSLKTHASAPAVCRLVVCASVGNREGYYHRIAPQCAEMKVPEAVVRESGARKYDFI